MSLSSTQVDRAAAVRAGLRALVAERGFHGASMSAVAAEAGVAVGTAYVHYASKDDLVIATYLETKRELAEAATADVDGAAPAHDRFVQIWLGIHAFLDDNSEHAGFLVQVESSPYAATAHERAMATPDDPIMAEAAQPDLAELLAPLPFEVLYDLGLAPAIRLAASRRAMDGRSLALVAEGCWRAVTTGMATTERPTA